VTGTWKEVVSKNLNRYRSENNFVGLDYQNNYVGRKLIARMSKLIAALFIDFLEFSIIIL